MNQSLRPFRITTFRSRMTGKALLRSKAFQNASLGRVGITPAGGVVEEYEPFWFTAQKAMGSFISYSERNMFR